MASTLGSGLFGVFALVMGLLALWAAIFGKDFRWGEDGEGPPMPREIGALFFGVLGLLFTGAGVVYIVNALMGTPLPVGD